MNNGSNNVEMETKKVLDYKDEQYFVVGAFSHPKLSYVTIDVKDENNNAYTICDSNDVYYDRIKTIKVQKVQQGMN